MKVAGIDYSTNAVDIVVVNADDREPFWMHFPLHGQDAFDRTRNVSVALLPPRRPDWGEIAAVGIEEPNQRGPASVQFVPKLKAVQGAVLSCIPQFIAVAPIGATEWKKACGLKGNAKKDEVAAWAREQIDQDVGWEDFDNFGDWTQDAYDAYCIARCILNRLVVTA